MPSLTSLVTPVSFLPAVKKVHWIINLTKIVKKVCMVLAESVATVCPFIFLAVCVCCQPVCWFACFLSVWGQ